MSTNLACQEEFREELIDGKLVSISPAAPRHNIISGNIFYIFKGHLRGKNCVPFADGTTVQLTDKDRFIPDFMVVCDRDKIKSQWVAGAPDLVAEILSPSTAKNDKCHLYDDLTIRLEDIFGDLI